MDSINYNKDDHTFTCKVHSLRDNAIAIVTLSLEEYEAELQKWYSFDADVHEHNRKNGILCFNDWLLAMLSFYA